MNILLTLQSKKFVTTKTFSEKYKLSERTIYRDLKALNEIGVPIYFEPNKGYGLMEGYFLPPLTFTIEEANSLLLLQTLADKFTDKSILQKSNSALEKIKAVLKYNDWVKFTLDLPMISEPGKSLPYCTGCALTLGSLVEIVTDNNIENLTRINLFEPMGISNYNWVFEPNKASLTNFSQLKLTPRGLVKLAKMYKDDGKWKNIQIISKNWIDMTFGMEGGDYGYLWYQKYFEFKGKRYSSYQASGNGGQKINIWSELDMITVFTGGNYNSYQLYGKSTPPNRTTPNYILKSSK